MDLVSVTPVTEPGKPLDANPSVQATIRSPAVVACAAVMSTLLAPSWAVVPSRYGVEIAI